ncbi:MAG: YraN family protein [Ornithinimicrobium sp.]
MAHPGMPHRQARDVGDRGEDAAAAHLRARGVRILERNWRCAHGELDIVGLDGDDVVFYEVKTRRSGRFGHPAEAVTPAKAARLRRLAGLWLSAHPHLGQDLRIDVLALRLRGAGSYQVDHLRGVA